IMTAPGRGRQADSSTGTGSSIRSTHCARQAGGSHGSPKTVRGGGPDDAVPDFGVPNPAAVAFVVLGLIWGSNFLFMKWAAETISAGQITLLRVLCGFLPVLLYAAARGDFRRSHLRSGHHFPVLWCLG